MWWIALTFGLSLIAVIGDYFIKVASNQRGTAVLPGMITGMIFYSITALGWFWAMRHLKLTTIGVYFAVSSILYLSFVGAVIFHEKLNTYEIIGVILAIISIILLARFS